MSPAANQNRKAKKATASGDEKNQDEPDIRTPGEKRADAIRGEGSREIVESIVVAFILALLFRSFIAEAFVIPTGSMAPTLMGAHKDVSCDRCGTLFPVGASVEQRPAGEKDGRVYGEAIVVGGVCPNCRHANSLDLADTPDHETFSGDRILVSKFAYAMHDPDRWDVIVFKFPGNPKQNYIKRLVGLPEEELRVNGGDVYAKPLDSADRDEILRKPPAKLLAMRHLVCDTAFQPTALIEAGYPSRWLAWSPGATAPPTDSWQVQRDADGLTATVKAPDQSTQNWIRYYHRWASDADWNLADAGRSVATTDPYTSRLITDFYSYDSSIITGTDSVYSTPPALNGSVIGNITGANASVFRSRYESGGPFNQFDRYSVGADNTGIDGMHWVGDLIVETEIETSSSSKQLTLEIVEAGVRYLCDINLQNGTATLAIKDGQQTHAFDNAEGKSPTASTSLTAGAKHRVRFSNADDQLLVWVDDSVVDFDLPTTFDRRSFRPDAENHPRNPTAEHPMDASPVGIAVTGGEATISHLRIDRDKYYIATAEGSRPYDYEFDKIRRLSGNSIDPINIQQEMNTGIDWEDSVIWESRRSVSFRLEADQFFPMGDNSPASLDARCWAESNEGYRYQSSADDDAYLFAKASYVPRDLLVGKAMMIFWPHMWNSPVPFTPNFKRIQLIK